MIDATVAPLPVLSEDGPQHAMVRQLATGSSKGPRMSGCRSWMPYDASWYMWRCDCPVPAMTLVIDVALGMPAGSAVPSASFAMLNISAAMLRVFLGAVP